MKNHNSGQEWISALADGELANDQIDAALKKLRTADERASWDLYHQIGDVLRSDDMDVPLSAGFAARMAARLEAEPAMISPAASVRKNLSIEDRSAKAPMRYAKPAMAAAFLVFAVASAPQWIGHLKSNEASHGVQVAVSAGNKDINTVSVKAVDSLVLPVRDSRNEVQLQDRHIDEYLFAHQRFSPSVNNTDQLVHQVSLASDSSK